MSCGCFVVFFYRLSHTKDFQKGFESNWLVIGRKTKKKKKKQEMKKEKKKVAKPRNRESSKKDTLEKNKKRKPKPRVMMWKREMRGGDAEALL